jgi:hypothetical protein
MDDENRDLLVPDAGKMVGGNVPTGSSVDVAGALAQVGKKWLLTRDDGLSAVSFVETISGELRVRSYPNIPR